MGIIILSKKGNRNSALATGRKKAAKQDVWPK